MATIAALRGLSKFSISCRSLRPHPPWRRLRRLLSNSSHLLSGTVMDNGCSIRALDGDCLRMIVSELRPGRSLHSLSLTCKWLRESCLDVLFERCVAFPRCLDDPARSFPPPHLWQYVRILRMLGSFKYPSHSTDTFDHVDDESICQADVLAKVLHAMLNLHSVAIVDEAEAGLPWPISKVILSVPQLRSFDLFGRLSYIDDMPTRQPFSPSPIASFRFVPQDERRRPRSSPSEKRILGALLGKLTSTLQTLHMPCEAAPFQKLDTWDWPRLQELYLRGDGRRIMGTGRPLISLLRHMPRLRCLSLKLALSKRRQSLSAIWPPQCEIDTIPWPGLESLTLGWLDPEEQLFQHLPSSFRELHLRSWPRHYLRYMRSPVTLENVQSPAWSCQLPTSSSVMRALQDCQLPGLERLELEYEADSNEMPMLRLIAQSCPDLQWLQLYRYRHAEDLAHAPSEDMSKALSPLRNLRTLRLFLDFHHIMSDVYDEEPVTGARVDELMNTAVRHFACISPPTLQSIHLLLVDEYGDYWQEFGVARDQDGCPILYRSGTYDPDYDEIGIADLD